MDETMRIAVDIAHSTVWATVVTVDAGGRPRARVLHPIWLEDQPGSSRDDSAPAGVEGFAITRPTPLKRAHLAAHPYVTCAYLAADHGFAHFDCDAALVDDIGIRHRAWDSFAAVAPPLGYDFAAIFPEGPHSADLTVLRMRPFRVRTATGAALARGEAARIWTARSPAPALSPLRGA
jgi:hypothetical protein